MPPYAVLLNDRGPRAYLLPDDTFRVTEVGATEDVNERFGPMGHEVGPPLKQLERIRALLERGGERGLHAGDVISFRGTAYLYTGRPREGGFEAINDPALLAALPD